MSPGVRIDKMAECGFHLEYEHRISTCESLICSMKETINDIKSLLNAYGLSMIITLIIGFLGIIVTLYLK